MLDYNPPANAHIEPGLGDALHEDDEHAHYYEPSEHSEPLRGTAPLPTVKRFNRKTVGVFAAAVGIVAVAAFGTALSKRPPAPVQPDAPAQKAPANATASDAVNALPSDYSQVPRLGAAVPGEVGEAARSTASATSAGARPGGFAAGGGAGPRPLTPYEQYQQQAAIEAEKRRAKALESNFGFTGDSGEPSASLGGNSGLAGLSGVRAGAPLPLPASARDDDNRQDDKEKFLDASHGGRYQLSNTVQKPASPYTLFTGTLIPGVLITGINSDLPGQIKGQISQNVYDTVTGKYLLLPQGTTIIGEYDSRITYGQERVLVVWTRIIRPDGSNLDLEGMPGIDMTGYAGITGDVDRHIGRLLSAVVLGSVIQAGAQAGTSTSALGTTSAGDAARQGIGNGINTATQQIVRKELAIQPTITVAPGERFNIFTTKDIVIPPY